MRVDLVKQVNSSFLSCEKDIEIILKKLFVESGQASEDLKRLLIINNKNCLDDRTSEVFRKALKEKGSIKKLFEEGYIRLTPKIHFEENEEVKSYILITIDGFSPNVHNPEFRDCNIIFDVICHTDYWDIGNFRQRPLKILGYIDGILNKSKLAGIGTIDFLIAEELVLNNQLSGYTLMYRAVHGSDDVIPIEE